jgi:hypothetical protein
VRENLSPATNSPIHEDHFFRTVSRKVCDAAIIKLTRLQLADEGPWTEAIVQLFGSGTMCKAIARSRKEPPSLTTLSEGCQCSLQTGVFFPPSTGEIFLLLPALNEARANIEDRAAHGRKALSIG